MAFNASAKPRLILASASPRRHELLNQLDLAHVSIPADLAENIQPNENVEEFVSRLAREKAEAVAAKKPLKTPCWVLGADTIVYLPANALEKKGKILGKPKDIHEARTFLQLLSGVTHQVITGFCILQMQNEPVSQPHKHEQLVKSQVQFRTLRPIDVDQYLKSREWQDKAGAYAIQGEGGFLIHQITGSYTNIIGLPLQEVLAGLTALGFFSNET